MDMIKIKELACEHMGNKRSHTWKEKGNKFFHGERVAKLVIELRKCIIPENSNYDDILVVAAWFHDICNGDHNHCEEGAVKTRELLEDYCSEYELNEICNIINVHDNRHCDRNILNDYTKLHQDADLLDHFGTYDIWMLVAYAISHDMSIEDVIKWFQTEWPEENSKHRAELNFEISKAIFDDKTKFVQSFADRLGVEGVGEIWKLV